MCVCPQVYLGVNGGQVTMQFDPQLASQLHLDPSAAGQLQSVVNGLVNPGGANMVSPGSTGATNTLKFHTLLPTCFEI